MAHLQHRAVAQGSLVDALAVDEGAVLRRCVLHHPLAEDALQTRMRSGHPSVVDFDAERRPVACGRYAASAADDDAVGVADAEPSSVCERRVATEQKEQVRGLLRTRGSPLPRSSDRPRIHAPAFYAGRPAWGPTTRMALAIVERLGM